MPQEAFLDSGNFPRLLLFLEVLIDIYLIFKNRTRSIPLLELTQAFFLSVVESYIISSTVGNSVYWQMEEKCGH